MRAGDLRAQHTDVIGLEATVHYHLTLVEYLVSLGYQVALLNPLRAAHFRRSQGKRAKTDRLDAQAQARFLAVRSPAPQPVPSQAQLEVRELTASGQSLWTTARP